MDDPVLRGRVISVGLAVIGAFFMAWCISRKTNEATDSGSELHTKLVEGGCERGGLARGSAQFQKCVEIATKRCHGGGVAKNIDTCARAIASQEN